MALYKLNNVWIEGNKLKTSTKIKLYKSLVKSILFYNCRTWALTLTEEERLNAYHRGQLKKILSIRYPKKITNKSLYRTCQEKPLSLQILSDLKKKVSERISKLRYTTFVLSVAFSIMKTDTTVWWKLKIA